MSHRKVETTLRSNGENASVQRGKNRVRREKGHILVTLPLHHHYHHHIHNQQAKIQEKGEEGADDGGNI